MTKKLDLYLNEELCGIVTDNGGTLAFKYDDAYEVGNTPLSLSMPLEVKEHPNRVIKPFLSGLLPDNANAMAALSKRLGVSANSPFAILEKIGIDVAGAIKIYPHGEKPSRAIKDSAMKYISDEEIENELLNKVTEYTNGLTSGFSGGRISLAGAQPKIALHRTTGGRWVQPNEKYISTHIIKPVTGVLGHLDIVEHLTLEAARAGGLNVCDSEIVEFGKIHSFVATRYDRELDQSSGDIKRVHQEDFCQALGVAPENKYQNAHGGPGVGAISSLLSRLPNLEDRRNVARAFFKALVFNIYAKCPDAHAKNYSLLLTSDRVELAPLYDLATGIPYQGMNKSAMAINDKYLFTQISMKDLVREAKRLKIMQEEAENIVDTCRTQILFNFEKASTKIVKDVENVEPLVRIMAQLETVLTPPIIE